MGILKNMLDQIKVGDYATHAVGSDRYPYRVSRIERMKDGRVKAVWARQLENVRYKPYEGYPVEGWKDEAVESEMEQRFPVVLSGRRKGWLAGLYVGDDALPYMDPHF